MTDEGPLYEAAGGLSHMRGAIASVSPRPEVAARLHAYFEMAADAMRNRD